MRRRVLAVAFVSVYGTLAAAPARGQTALHKIGELDVPLLGLSATLDPPNPVVPKNTASGIRVVVKAGGRELSGAEVNQLVGGSFVVQAELAGPGLPGTISVPLSDDTTSTDSLLLRLPALTTAGDYALSNARIVVGGRTVLDTTPADVTVNVIDQVLITSVKTKPLTLDEIKALGIVLDNDSYQGFSFTLGMKVDSKAVSFSFPVVFNQAGVQVPQPLSPPPEPPLASVQLPSLPPVTVVPMLLSGAGGSKGGSQKLVLPGGGEVRIPAVLVIPGNVGYLKQFFSAQLFVANGAPAGSGLVVHDVTGTITLPPGADQVLGTADDPLTLPATNKGPQAPTQAVKGVGPDGAPGTADDTDSFAPGEQGVVEFAIRAEKEGLYTVDFEVNAVLEGLPVGPVNVSGTASGGVLVRNPYFNVTFTVPSVVRTGERFHLFTTVTNIGSGLANAVTVSLDQGAMSGATLVGSSSQQIPTLRPGDSRQLDFEFRSLRTGQVVATYLHLDTSDGSTGKLQFTLGVGERGIPLSPDTLVLPTAVDQLPSAVVDAAMRVLGQAWSIANAPAGTLPAGVTRTSKGAVTKKALALAEAGLRVTLGQSQADAVRDLALDFFSAPPIDAGFDQLLRETDAGHALAIAIGSFLEDPTVEGTEGHAGSGVAQAGGALEYERQVAQLAASGPDFISFAVGNGAAGSSATVWVEDRLGRKSGFGREATAIPTAQIPGAVLMPLGDPATSAVLGLVGSVSASPYTLYLTSNDGTPFDISVTVPRDDGTFLRGTLRGVMLPQDTPARVAVDLSSPEPLVLQQDVNHDATFTGQTPFAEETLAPQGPTLVSATVIGPSVLDGASPYGMQAILVFDRIVDAAGAGTPANYAIPANSVFTAARQMSGRLVTLALTAPEGPYIATTVSASGIADLRGATANGTVELHSLDQLPGAVVTGRVLKADGTPVTSGSVIYSNDSSPTECAYPAEVGLTQIALGGDGRYGVHYVVQGTCGLPFEVTTQDPVNGETRKASAHVLYAGQVLVLDITLLGRGAVTGTVYDGNNRPAPGAHVTAVSSADLQSGGTAVTDIGGHYTVEDLAVGPVSVTAALGTALGRAAGRIDRAGTTDTVDVTLDSGAVKVAGVVWKVENGKSSAAPGALVVYSIQPDGSPSWLPVGVTYTGTDGSYAMTVPGGKYSITASVDQAHSAEIHGTATPPVTIDGDIAVVFQPPQSYGTVSGTVKLPSGVHAPAGVVVTIGRSGVLTDDAGRYAIPNVEVKPYQNQSVQATTQDGLRTGSASVVVNGPGEVTGVDITLSGIGSVQFVVQDPAGRVLANQPVSLFGYGCEDECGCGTKNTDQNGLVVFDGFPVGSVTAHALRRIGGVTDEARGAASITKDGDTATGLLKFAGLGSVTGTVLAKMTDAEGSWQGVYGATVVLRSNHFVHDPSAGICTLLSGVAQTVQTNDQGQFAFSGVSLGAVSLTATQDFYPTPAGAQGNLAKDGDSASFTLKLVSTISGVLKGTVYLPDGVTPAGAGVQVTANGALPDVTVSTNADGEYRFARIFPAGADTITAIDPVTGGVHRDNVYLQAAQDVTHDIRLKGRGTVTVTVVDALGAAVSQAYVKLTETEYPQNRYQAALDASTEGAAVFSVFEGPFTVEVKDVLGRGGRASSSVPAPGSEVPVKVSLSVTGTVRGHFLMPDGVTPIPGGTVTLKAAGQTVGQLATPATGDVGSYSFEYVPGGDIRLDAEDPLTGRTGFALGRIDSPTPPVLLDVVAQALGSVKGTVTLNGSAQPSARVHVVSQGYDTIAYCDATGQYAIDGVPAGRVVATASLAGGLLAGTNAGTLASEGQVLQVDVALRGAGTVQGTVRSADDTTAAPLSLVTIQAGGVGGGTTTTTTDTDGSFAVDLVPAGHVDISVQVLGDIDQARARAEVPAGDTVTVPILLNGVGRIVGQVRDSQGNPTSGSVWINGTGPFEWSHFLVVGGNGDFELPEVLAGPFTATLRHDAQVPSWGNASGSVTPGQQTELVISLQPSATVSGRVLRSDGATPGFGAWVTLTPSGGGTFRVQAGPDGRFSIDGVPLGTFSVGVSDPITTGIARLLDRKLTTDGVPLDLGDIVEDDHPPTVRFVSPVEGSTQATVGGPLALEVADLGAGLDTTTLTLIYQNQYYQSASSFQFDGGQAKGMLLGDAVAIGTNTLTARIADLAGNVTSATTTFTVTGGTITGHVHAADGSTSQGVSVRVDNTTPLLTGSDGSYAKGGLRPGNHTVTATDPVTGVPVSGSAYLYDGDLATVDLTLPAAGRISGHVTHPGGSAAPGFTATCSGAIPPRTAQTDAAGFFDLGPLPIGSYGVHASKTGTDDQGDAPPPVTLSSPGQQLAVTVALNGVGRVDVAVRDATGQTAIPNAPVSLTSSATYSGSPHSGRTDDTGRISFTDVLAGTITAHVTDPLTGLPADDTAGPLTDGASLTLAARLRALGTVTGTVTHHSGSPAKSVTVTLSGGRSTATGEDGTFTFANVPLGQFSLEATDPDGDRGAYGGVLQNNGDTSTVPLTLNGLGAVTVTVSERSGEPAAATVQLSSGSPFGGYYTGSTGSEGTITFPRVLAGSLTATAIVDNPYRTQTVTGSLAADRTATLAITLPATGGIAGHVYAADGRTPVQGAVVSASGAPTPATTSDDGAYALSNVAVGTYTLEVRVDGRLRGRVPNLTINDAQTALTQDVTLVAAGTVAGTVEDSTGNLAAGASVTLQSTTAYFGGTFGPVTTGTGGVFTIPGVPQGSFSVSATKGTQRVDRGGELTTDGQTVTLALQMLSNAVTVPTSLYDGNVLQWVVSGDGTLQAAWGDWASSAGRLSLTQDGTTRVFTGSGNLVAAELNGRQVVLDQAGVGSFHVTRRVFVPNDGYFARYLDVIENVGPVDATVDVGVDFPVNLGWYPGVQVAQTASGNPLSAADAWFSLDDSDLTKNVFQGWRFVPLGFVASGSTGTTPTALGYDGSTVHARWTAVGVPAGGSRSLLYVVTMQGDRERAAASAARLASLPPELLVGLTPQDAAAVLNFEIPADLSSAPEPLRNDGTITGRALAGDGQTPLPVVNGAQGVFKSRSPYLSRPITFGLGADGSYLLKADTTRQDSGKKLIPRAPFDLTLTYVQPGPVSAAVTGDFPATGTIDLTSVVGRTVQASSSYAYPNACCLSTNAADADLQTVWQANESTTKGQFPHLEVVLPADATLSMVKLRGRHDGDLLAIQQARVEVRTADGTIAWSQVVDLPAAPYRDADLAVPEVVGRSVRVVDLKDASSTPGLAEIQVIGQGSLGRTGRADVDAVFTGTGILAGQVLRTDGSAVAGGSIELFDGTNRVTKTPDGSGRFTFLPVPAGEYTLTATHPLGSLAQAVTVSVAAGVTTTANVVYPALGSVHGTLRSAAGLPIYGWVSVTGADNFRRQVSANAQTGYYSLPDLPTGSVTVTATDNRSQAVRSAPVEVVAGTAPDTDFTFPPVGKVPVTVRLGCTDPLPSCPPLPSARIYWSAPDVGLVDQFAGYTDVLGQLTVNNVPGSATLRAVHPAQSYATGTATATIPSDGTSVPVTIAVSRVTTLSGSLRSRSGAPYSLAAAGIGQATVTALDADGNALGAVNVDAAGGYQMANVPVGPVRLHSDTTVAYSGLWLRSNADVTGTVADVPAASLDALASLGSITTPGQRDLWSFEAQAGQPVSLLMVGWADGPSSPLQDPYLEVRRLDGSLVAHNDNRSSTNLDSETDFTAPETGTYVVTARAAGAQLGGYRLGSWDAQLTLRPFQAPAQVTGQVTRDSDGQPAPGIRVQIAGSGNATVTGSQGQYTLPLFAFGEFDVEVVAADGVIVARQHGSSTRAGNTVVDLTVPPHEAVTVTVHRLAAPMVGITVTLSSDHPGALPEDANRARVTSAQGVATTSLPVGVVRAQVVDPQTGSTYGSSQLLGEGSPLTLDLALPQNPTVVSGTVFLPDNTTPLPGATVEIAGVGTRTTEATGSYRFEAVPEGSRTVTATFSGVSIQTTINPTGTPLTVNLAVPIASLTGQVSDPAGPVAGVRVAACAYASNWTWLCAPTTTGADGRYLIIGLPAWQNYAGVSVTATLGDGSGLTAYGSFTYYVGWGHLYRSDLVLPVTSAVKGTVLDADGNAVPGAPVTLQGSRTTTSDLSGQFRFMHVVAGSVYVYAESPDNGIPGGAEGTVVAGQDLTLDVRLLPTAHLTGVLVDAQDQTVADAAISVAVLEVPDIWNASDGWARSTTTGPDGTFDLPVPAGRYQAVFGGTPDADGCDMLGLAAMEGVLAAGASARVVLKEGSAVELSSFALSGPLGRYGNSRDCSQTPRPSGFVDPYGGTEVAVRELDDRAVRSLTAKDYYSRLRTRRQVFVPASGAFSRTLTVLTNPTSLPLSGSAYLRLRLGDQSPGRDLDWTVLSTSTGVAELNSDTGWAVFRQPQRRLDDAAVVLGDGSDGATKPDSAWFIPGGCGEGCSGGYVEMSYPITVPPGETRAVLSFSVSRPAGDATAITEQARALASLRDLNALAGLTPQERASIVNFTLPQVGQLTVTVTGTGIAGASVGVLDSTGQFFDLGRTDVPGVLTAALPYGEYTVVVGDPTTGAAARAGVTIDSPARTVSVALEPIATGTVLVHGTWSSSSRPAAGATLIVHADAFGDLWDAAVVLDSNGDAVVPGLPAGAVTVRWAAPFVGDTGTGTLAGGGSLSVTVSGDAGGTLEGHVYAGDGETPIGNASVQVLDATDGTVLAWATADDGGHYGVDTIRPGRDGFLVRVTSPIDRAAYDTPGGFAYEGEPAAVDVRLPHSVIKGKVSYFDGDAVEHLSVFVTQADAAGRTTASYPYSTTAEGDFVFLGVAVGPFDLTAQDYQFGLTAEVAGTIAAVQVPVVLPVHLPATGTLEVTVDSAGAACTDACNVALASEGQFDLTEYSYDGRTFGFDRVVVGAYVVQAVEGPTSLRTSARGVLSAPGEAQRVHLDVPATASISGRVRHADGTPVTYGSLVLVGLDNDGPLGPFKTYGRVASDGRYSLSDIPVGRVRVAVPADASAASTPTAGYVDATLTTSGLPGADVTMGNAYSLPATLTGADGFAYQTACDGMGQVGGYPGDDLKVQGGWFGCQDAGVAATDRTVSLGPSALGTLVVTRKVFVPAGGGFARYLELLSNPGAAPVTTRIGVESDFSYSSDPTDVGVTTVPGATSNTYAVAGNASWEAAYVFGGPDATVRAVVAGLVTGTASFESDWDVTVPPGGTVAVMHFTVQRAPGDTAGAEAQAQALVGLADPNALAGLSPEERAEVVNFHVPAGTDQVSALATDAGPPAARIEVVPDTALLRLTPEEKSQVATFLIP